MESCAKLGIKSVQLAKMLDSPQGKKIIQEATLDLGNNEEAEAGVRVIVNILDRCICEIDPTADLPHLFKCLKKWFLKEGSIKSRRLGGQMFALVNEMAQCLLAARIDLRERETLGGKYREWLKKLAREFNGGFCRC